ncbi:MAG: DNA-binding protein [Oscillospiraceae bacterium]|nr:DNA-binding protein [Oscillospiraceae bacterium]
MGAQCIGFDTSNYTTSAAVFGNGTAENRGKLLTVPEGALGLRQSDALFQHVKRLHLMVEQLRSDGGIGQIAAVGASTRPREVDGSYMPCFLVGEGEGRALASALGVPFYPCSHQQGHVAAAAWSAGREDLLDRPHLAWHLSGGTTELLRVEPEGHTVRAEIVGGTADIAAGQLIDRAGVLLGLPFPAGKALDALYPEADDTSFFRVKLNDLTFSLSGMENQVKGLAEKGETPANIARFTIDTIMNVLLRATQEAQKRWPGLPVLCSGGVASNRQIRDAMEKTCGAVFALPQYATDNALGVAILTHRALERGVPW